MINLTRDDFLNLEECECGKPFFKFNNSSKNTFIAKCANFKEEYDMKTKKWTTSKKQPCGDYYVYHGPRPVFKEIQKAIVTKYSTTNTLEERLKALFRFLFVSKYSSTIQEIDLIVQNELNREPRKTFYYPTTGLFMKISHKESYEDYRDRIFSIKIVPNYKPQVIKEKEPIIKIVDHPFVNRTDKKPVIRKKVNLSKNTLPKQYFDLPKQNNFIIVSDSDSGGESESERNESETDPDSDKDESDYEDTETEIINDLDDCDYTEDFDGGDDYGDYDD
jgi:hypothetical protein